MMSKSKNSGDSWGTLYGRPMEGLVFHYDRHEEITIYIQMRNMHHHPMVMRVFCLPLNILACFVIPEAIQYNLISLSTVVLNSRDRQGNYGFPNFHTSSNHLKIGCC